MNPPSLPSQSTPRARVYVCVHMYMRVWIFYWVSVGHHASCWVVISMGVYVCGKIYWCAGNGPLVCVTLCIDVCDVTHWCVWRDALMCVTWPIDVWDMAHWCVLRHGSGNYARRSCVTISHVSHIYESYEVRHWCGWMSECGWISEYGWIGDAWHWCGWMSEWMGA